MSALKLLADAFHEGGWPMWPILAIMIITWGITIERVIYLKKAGIDKEKLLALLKSQIMAGTSRAPRTVWATKSVAAELAASAPATRWPCTAYRCRSAPPFPSCR